MTDRNLMQRCTDHDGCIVSTLIEDTVTIPAGPDTQIVDARGTVHAQGWHLAEGEDPNTVKHFTAREFVAWTSHAPAAAHPACRIGNGGKWDQIVTLDHTDAEPGQLVDDPPVVRWQPMCADCHVIFQHVAQPHHASGLARRADGQLVVHRDHAMFDALEGAAEQHEGSHYSECPRCAPQADACDGCRAVMEQG